jgi:hypothetical protein
MKIDDVAPNSMFGEHPDHGGYAADRVGVGTEVMDYH